MTAAADRFHLRHIGWLMLSLVLVTAPHVERLPWWVTLLAVTLFTWRIYLALYGLKLPRKWLLLAIVAGALGGIYISYGRILGRDSGVTLLVVLLALKLMEMATLRDAMVLIFIAYFLVITNFLYSQSIPTTIYMLGVVWLITATMVGFQFRTLQPGYRYQLRTAGIMLLQSAPLMLALFVLFPRVQGPLWGLPQDAYAGGVTGLSDEMTPGSVSNLILSDAVAFRVTFESQLPPPTQQLYWRGPVLWDFDGYTWSAPRVPYLSQRQYEALDSVVEYTVTVEPHGKRWLFALDLPAKTPPRSVMTSDFQLLFQTAVVNRVRYDMASHLRYRNNSEPPRYELQRALQLPGRANPRARELARSMRKQAADDRAYIDAVLSMFRNQNFYYTTTPPNLDTNNAVDEFLFTSRAGFCEHYASSFAMLMRAAGVPARIVTGYQGGELNTVGNYMIVRQADAHAWVEVWLKDEGWVRVDPTAAVSPARVEAGVATAVPQGETRLLRGEYRWLHRARLTWDSLANSWNQIVLGYTLDRQRQLMQRVGIDDATWQSLVTAMFVVTGAITLALAAVMLRKLHAMRPDPVAAAYARFCERLARRGLARHPSEGPDAFRKRAAAARPELAQPIGTISELYIRLRYGNVVRTEDAARLQNEVEAFRA